MRNCGVRHRVQDLLGSEPLVHSVSDTRATEGHRRLATRAGRDTDDIGVIRSEGA